MVGMAVSSGGDTERQAAQIPVADELNRLLGQHLWQSGVAQGAQFGHPLGRVTARLGGRDVTGVTAQFGDRVLDLALEHLHQALEADLFEVGLPTPLAVKTGKVAHRGMFAQG